VTTIYAAPGDPLTAEGVYPPQDDSLLLIDTMARSRLVPGRRVLDLCTGTGVVAIAAAELGAASVTAFDICPSAVRCSRGNAVHAGVDVDVREGSWTGALGYAPFDLIVSNPPYVPTPPVDDSDEIASAAGPSWAWNAGPDGRLVLDPLCEAASDLLCAGGSLLLVQSVIADAGRSLEILQSNGLSADVVATRWIPFGPVLSARARWLTDTARLPHGSREEELIVIRADKP
jgi:release factor glutamine methyltransferase